MHLPPQILKNLNTEVVNVSELGGIIRKARFPAFCQSLGLLQESDDQKLLYNYIETLFFPEDSIKIEVGVVQSFMQGLMVPQH
jgi:hypothetical protein